MTRVSAPERPPDSARVAAHQVELQAFDIAFRNFDVAQLAEPGIDSVDRGLFFGYFPHYAPRRLHRFDGIRREPHRLSGSDGRNIAQG